MNPNDLAPPATNRSATARAPSAPSEQTEVIHWFLIGHASIYLSVVAYRQPCGDLGRLIVRHAGEKAISCAPRRSLAQGRRGLPKYNLCRLIYMLAALAM